MYKVSEVDADRIHEEKGELMIKHIEYNAHYTFCFVPIVSGETIMVSPEKANCFTCLIGYALDGHSVVRYPPLKIVC